jgi:hypothetical protein
MLIFDKSKSVPIKKLTQPGLSLFGFMIIRVSLIVAITITRVRALNFGAVLAFLPEFCLSSFPFIGCS